MGTSLQRGAEAVLPVLKLESDNAVERNGVLVDIGAKEMQK